MDCLSSLERLFPWANEVINPCSVLVNSRKNNDRPNQLESLIRKSIKLLREEISDLFSIQDVKCAINLHESLIKALNDVHSSLAKELPNFDDQLLPLIENYVNLLVHDARTSDCSMESKKKLRSFLSHLSIHPNLDLAPSQRVQSILSQLLLKHSQEDHDPLRNINSSSEVVKHTPQEKSLAPQELEPENKVSRHGETEKMGIPFSEPKSPFKNPTCVGMASIRDIMPFSSGFMIPLTPPVNSSDVDNSLGFQRRHQITPKPTQPSLLKFQEYLRKRFRRPFAVTLSERRIHRVILKTINSERRPKRVAWQVHEFSLPSRKGNSPIQSLYVETDQNSETDKLDLHYSPDQESSVKTSIPNEPVGETVCVTVHEEPNKLDSTLLVPSSISSTQEIQTEDEDQETKAQSKEDESLEKNTSSEKRCQEITDDCEDDKTEDSYSALKKSIDGNLLGCEASISDVEIMDEIESSLNLEGDEEKASFCTNAAEISDSLACKEKLLNSIATKVPVSSSCKRRVSDEDDSSDTANKPINSALKRNRTQFEKQERRRSSRLAGIPALPLKYTTDPLPDCRRVGPKKSSPKPRTDSRQLETVPSSPSLNLDPDVPSNTLPSKNFKNDLQVVETNWKEFSLWFPKCWADILEKHVLTYHPDGILRIKESGSPYPSLTCGCAQIDQASSSLHLHSKSI